MGETMNGIDRMLSENTDLNHAVGVLIDFAKRNGGDVALTKWDELRRLSSESRTIRLSKEDQEAFASACINPAPVAPALDRAMGRRRELLGVDVDALRAKLTERGREIVRLEKELESRPKFFPHGVIESLERQLSASQAREREAVERAEKAEAQAAEESGNCTYSQREWKNAESALAAARKALEKLVSAMRKSSDRKFQPDDAETHWLVELPMTDEEYDIYRAALNGDSHA